VLVLGIESSCDETAAAVLRDGGTLLSDVVSSQVKVHAPYGGVVPELASREHIRNIVPVVRRALEQAAVELAELEGIAVTHGPGLQGALLVGVQLAKAVAYTIGCPLVGVNHLEGHLVAPFLDPAGDPPPDRHVALLVSGGHTGLVLVEGFGKYTLLGRTRDDAAGEAFDKVAKLLELGYPGGPVIERLARAGDGAAIRFPRALPQRDTFDFSFSGLKTAVANHLRREGTPAGEERADLCASFQQAVADVLVTKARRAVRRHRASALVAAGGVLANGAIREALRAAAEEDGFALHLPPIHLCTDNGAMIAAAGARRLDRGERSGMDLAVAPRLPLAARGAR
jgi:N6-L-threonylcarbamoyladenine synthase